MAELTLERDVLDSLNQGKEKKGEVRAKIELDTIPTEAFHVWIDQKTEIIVIPTKTGVRAYNSICPHMGAQLQYDEERKVLACPWHELDFDLETKLSNHHAYKRVCEHKAELQEKTLVIYK